MFPRFEQIFSFKETVRSLQLAAYSELNKVTLFILIFPESQTFSVTGRFPFNPRSILLKLAVLITTFAF